MNHFTKQVEGYVVSNQEATTVARVYFNEFVSLYKVTYVINTDQKSKIESTLFKELCKFFNIAKTQTTNYNPQCDGQVERMNQVIIELLKLNVSNPTNNWDLDLGLVLMAYRSAVQSSTVYTFYYLLYANKMRQPLDIMYCPPRTEQTSTEYVRKLRTSLQDAHVTLRKKLQLAHQHHKHYYDR